MKEIIKLAMRILQMISMGIASLSLAAGAAPVFAQEQEQPPRPQVVGQFNEQVVTALLQDVRATWTVEQGADGNINYRANAEGGINFTLAPRACSEETGCLGMMMIAIFTGVNPPSTVQLDAFLNDFNDSSATAKVFRNEEGIVVLQGYINASYNISYRNAQTQLLIFGQDIVALSRALALLEQGG